jgi:hypothetical protein
VGLVALEVTEVMEGMVATAGTEGMLVMAGMELI